MLKKRLLFPLLSCFGLLLAAGPSWALGFRDASPSASLGQPLDFVVTLRVAPGEYVDPNCVRAEVALGENVVPSEGVVARLEANGTAPPRIRVRTYRRIDEPVVAVQVSAGCPSQVSRKYVVFADPPLMVAPAALAEVTPISPSSTLPSAAALIEPTPGAGQVTSAVSSVNQGERVDVVSPTLRRARRQARMAAALERATQQDGPVPREVAPRPRSPAPRRDQAPVAPKATATPAPAVVAQRSAPRSRLTLDAAPNVAVETNTALTEQALAVIDDANQAVLAAIAAASASQARMLALEASVERLRQEAEAQAALTVELRLRAEAGERKTFWFLPLLFGLLALIGLAMWLWMRVRELEMRRQQAWRRAAARQEDAPVAVAQAPVASVPVLNERRLNDRPPVAARGGLAPPAVPKPSELFEEPTPSEQTAVLPPPVAATLPGVAAEPKGVSAEELIDLEQQAEFFVVLGQDDSAIDLLVDHLRQTGGTSPLPYLKLLDIYRRRGERAAYERTRDRFNHRFNAHAPDWDAPSLQGRSLQEYPAVVHWIEQVWSTPIDAMAELEMLLFRRDGGELFDLPAYRELLFLYALARDLLDEESDGSEGLPVDVLLPLHDRPAERSSAEPIAQALESTRRPPAELATAPVDLDLSEPSDSSFRITR